MPTARSLLRLLASSFALLALAAPPAGATWSIVLVNTKTGEIGIAAATCLESLDLRKLLPVMVVSKGAGVAQSQIDTGAANRKKIFDQLLLGTPPAEIIQIALNGDFFKKTRQYGIVDLSPDAAGYTGGGAMAFKLDVHGGFDDYEYAIQGNVLTGQPVIDAAVQAVTRTQGSLGDRLMAGMEAARSMGGDGRCSCSPSAPTSCGSPPAAGFTKAAHIGFFMVARAGDTDGTCNATIGCATGSYWCNLNEANLFAADTDPVLLLASDYADFKIAAAGHPDGLRSLSAFDDSEVLGDGASTRQLTVALFDLDGHAILHGGATFTVTHAPGSAGLSQLGAVVDHGDGTYALELVAGAGSGTDLLSVRADDGTQGATLFPYPQLQHRPALLASAPELSAGSGAPLVFDLLGPTAAAGRTAVLLLSAAGTAPGQSLPGGLLLPLNPDRLFALSAHFGPAGVLAGNPGPLDALSHATVAFTPPAGSLLPFVGQTLSAAWATLRPADFVSNAVSVAVTP
ncbi:MAG TPA: DUF1028 domain-containing protein [Planctomycetota bacterium]|nr:DUF1028 domain-containing protein [Planctomycetota bacterium]